MGMRMERDATSTQMDRFIRGRFKTTRQKGLESSKTTRWATAIMASGKKICLTVEGSRVGKQEHGMKENC